MVDNYATFKKNWKMEYCESGSLCRHLHRKTCSWLLIDLECNNKSSLKKIWNWFVTPKKTIWRAVTLALHPHGVMFPWICDAGTIAFQTEKTETKRKTQFEHYGLKDGLVCLNKKSRRFKQAITVLQPMIWTQTTNLISLKNVASPLPRTLFRIWKINHI